MKIVKSIALASTALYCFLPAAQAQCNGQFAAGYVCGNATTSRAQPKSTPFSTFSNQVSVKSFGAKCDGSTDDRAAIQAAGDYAISVGKALFIDPSTSGCIVSQNGSNAYALLWQSPIEIVGLPGYSIIRPTSGLSSSVNIIYLTGTSNSYKRTVIDGIFIGNPSSGTRTGNHAIVFDTLTTGSAFYHPQIKNNYLQQGASGLGWSIFAINSQANNPTGGFVYGEIKDNFIGSGIALNKVGDSIRVVHNVITGTSSNPGVYLDLVNGAGGLAGNTVIDGNNIGGAAGAVIVDCAQAPLIINNEIEQDQINTEASNALVDINGATCTVTGARIVGNQLQASASMGNPTLIRVATSTNTVIDNNKIATPVDYVPIVITAGSTGTIIGAGNTFSGMTTQVTNGGTATRQGVTVVYGTTPFSGTKTVRASGGAADCTLVFVGGLLTGGSC
jgi:hypothetical protein